MPHIFAECFHIETEFWVRAESRANFMPCWLSNLVLLKELRQKRRIIDIDECVASLKRMIREIYRHIAVGIPISKLLIPKFQRNEHAIADRDSSVFPIRI